MGKIRFAAALAVVAALAPCQSAFAEGETPVQILWGIRPSTYPPYNGTRFLMANGSEWDAAAFNETHEMRLAWTGDGVCDETAGFAAMQWLGTNLVSTPTAIWGSSPNYTGQFAFYDDRTFVRLDFRGTLEELDPEDELYGGDWEALWQTFNFGFFVYDTQSKRAWRMSETSGGSDFATMVRFDSPIVEDADPLSAMMAGDDANNLEIVPNTESRAVYLGAEIPQKCVWMADKGLTAEELAGYGERTLELAMALDKAPEDVAGGVELKISGLEAAAGSALRLTWTLEAENSSGGKSAVSGLRGGAALWLETASSVGDLGTENATRTELAPSDGGVNVPTGANGLFARLVLTTP